MTTFLRLMFLGVAALLVAIAFDLGHQAQGQPEPHSFDPCGNSPSMFHHSVPIAVATSATTFLVAGDPNNNGPINICGQNVIIASTSTYALMSADAGTNCVTHLQNVTGPYTAGTLVSDGNGTIAEVPTGQDLCVKTTGTGAGGVISYVRYVGKPVSTVTATQTAVPTATPT